MGSGQDSPERSMPEDPASSKSRATKTYSHRLKSSRGRLLHEDDSSRHKRWLYNRADTEHVVLADCRSPNGVLTSEMAYFTGSPKSTPDDTAIVETPYNTTRLWANAKTSTLFPDTNTTFAAVLRPDVAQGGWAGTGDNGYGSFVCWEKSLPDLYHDEAVGAECSGVYDCDHEATPSVTPSSLAISTNSAAPSHTPSRSGLTQGALIGLIIGCVLFFLLILFTSTLIFIRHLAVHKGHTGGLYSLFVPKPKSPVPPPPPAGYWGPDVWMLNDPDRLRKIEYLGPQPGQVYEITGNHGYEAIGDERFPAREIDGVMLRGELPLSTPMPEMAAVGTPVEQFDRGRIRWKDDKGPLHWVESEGRGQRGS